MSQNNSDLRIVLQFEDVSKTYPSGSSIVEALKPTSFKVRDSELVAIMGPSGSGKSTLLSLAGAMDVPTQGNVFVFGQDLASLTPSALAKLRRQSVGYVFQELNLMPGLTAVENVTLPMELDGHNLNEARLQAMEALERVKIEHLAERFPDDLSGGEQQRVAIARAFVGTRTLLLADEPTGALDTTAGDVVMQLLRKQCDQGRSALLVTHNPSYAAWADRVIFIKDGRIVDETSSSTTSSGASTQ